MKIVCDSCGTKYSISDDKVRGKVFKIRCKKCSHIIVVRGTGDAAAAQPSASSDGGWHVVVDGEQVGPLPEAEVRAKLARGEVNGETYIWKEGFADWLKIATVPEFADAAGGAAAAPVGGGDNFLTESSAPVAVNGTENSSGRQRAAAHAGGGSLFGGAPAQAQAQAQVVEESDVFAAPTPAAGRGGGGDLFASAAAAQPAAEESRWPAVGGSPGNHDGGRVENLTGQRHENSVLFSLSNLQSLAMPAPAAKPISSSAPTSEGSGLIDIRAMAATTLGAPESKGGSIDDLPAFGAFSPAAPVLLPLPTSSGPSKWMYVAGIGALALTVVIAFMAYKILNTKTAPAVEPATTTASAPEAAKAPSGPVAAAAPAAAAPAKPSTIPDEVLPPREAPKAAGEAARADKGEHHHGKPGSKDKKGGGSDDKKSGAAAAAVAAGEPKEKEKDKEKEEKKPAKGSLDDLLDNAISSRHASRPRPAEDDAPKKAEAASAGPLSKGAIEAGMRSAKPKIGECYKQYKVQGTAMVKFMIERNGKVSSATVSGPLAGTPTGACVEKAAKGASFAPSDGLTISYPFLLR